MLRFTFRDVFWLSVAIAIGIGWSIDTVGVRREAAARIDDADLATDTLHDEYADLMAAIHDAGVRVHKQANGKYSVTMVPTRSKDPRDQPAGDAPFQRHGKEI